MKGSILASSLALAASVSGFSSPKLVERQSGSTPAITIKGNAFYRPDGSRFFIRGVDYQPGGASKPEDPIADTEACARDVKEFKKLGLNAIRVYTVDNSLNHDTCMKALSAAGIYLILDVNSGTTSLNRGSLSDLKLSYNAAYLQSVFATIDAFSTYDNTLAFFSGNEVINAPNNTNTAPYIKAVTRDMKAYIQKNSKRAIPVGYSAADVESNRVQTAHYLNCGSDDVRSDFFAFNDYSWCGAASSFQISGWADRVKEYSNYGIPLFLSEYGCNKGGTRTFPEISALYSNQMTGVYSGGLVYEYSQEESKYGLGTISAGSFTENKDFTNLEAALKKNPSPGNAQPSNPNGGASACPAQDSDWEPGLPDSVIPAIPKEAQKYITNGGGKALGLTQSGTQTNGDSGMSQGTSSAGKSGTKGSSTTSGSSTSNPAAALPIPAFAFGPLMSGLAVIAASVVGALLL